MLPLDQPSCILMLGCFHYYHRPEWREQPPCQSHKNARSGDPCSPDWCGSQSFGYAFGLGLKIVKVLICLGNSSFWGIHCACYSPSVQWLSPLVTPSLNHAHSIPTVGLVHCLVRGERTEQKPYNWEHNGGTHLSHSNEAEAVDSGVKLDLSIS